MISFNAYSKFWFFFLIVGISCGLMIFISVDITYIYFSDFSLYELDDCETHLTVFNYNDSSKVLNVGFYLFLLFLFFWKGRKGICLFEHRSRIRLY